MTTISSARTSQTVKRARNTALSADDMMWRITGDMALKYEVQRPAEHIGFVADPGTWTNVGKRSSIIHAIKDNPLQLQLGVEVLGKVPPCAGSHGVIVTQRLEPGRTNILCVRC